MDWIFYWLLFSSLAAWIASSRGHSAGNYFVLSLLLSPLIGVIAALVAKTPEGRDIERARTQGEAGDFRKCPSCAEIVRREAIKCRFCGVALEPLPSTSKDSGDPIVY